MAFFGNDASEDGGAIYNKSITNSAIIVSCLFSGNKADNGGGVYNESSNPIIVNSTFSGNQADAGSENGRGGGMYNDTSSNSVNIDNSIFWNNTAGFSTSVTDAQIHSEGTSPSVDFTCIKGGWSGGTGNISNNPRFIDAGGTDNIIGTSDDDAHLSTDAGQGVDSPCIDAGDSSQLPSRGGTQDLDLVDRADAYSPASCPADVDMGAYEVQDINCS